MHGDAEKGGEVAQGRLWPLQQLFVLQDMHLGLSMLQRGQALEGGIGPAISSRAHTYKHTWSYLWEQPQHVQELPVVQPTVHIV